MSKFKSLPTDNSKTSAPEGSIFYRPRAALTDQYKNARIKQQQKQQQLLSKIGAPSNSNNANKQLSNRRLANKLKPIGRIRLGRSHKVSKIELTANKPNTNKKMELLNNYKQKYSKTAAAKIDIANLSKDTFKCSLFKKSLQCNRAFIGHFVGSKGPKFAKSKIHSIREEDLQTKLERIEYDKSFNGKKRQEMIAKLKFEQNESDQSERPYHFEFVEESQCEWLGKPKEENKNYSYVIMEWLPCSNRSSLSATVYPAEFIEFDRSQQLISENQDSAESVEKRHRAQIEKWKKAQCEKSMMEKLGSLFGHSEDAKGGKNKKVRADEMTMETKLSLKNDFLQKSEITETEMNMLADLLGDEMYAEFVRELRELNDGKSGNLMIGDDRQKSLIDERVLSKRLKAGKTRGTVEELNDYDEVISDDEDERNMNNYDVLDDGEEDVWSGDEDDESEQNELFQKMKQNLGANLTEKEYEVPVADKKENSLFDEESDDENEGQIWRISDDEDDEDDDVDDDNVKIKKTQSANPKKRKLDDADAKNKNKKTKRRKLNDSKIDSNKLKEELTEIITKILKKFADGLDMITLWKKVNSALSYNLDAMKKAMGAVIKEICRRNTVQIDGKSINKYYLKKKYK